MLHARPPPLNHFTSNAEFKELFSFIFAITFTCKSQLRPTHFVLEYNLSLFLPTGDRLREYTPNDTFFLSYLKTMYA